MRSAIALLLAYCMLFISVAAEAQPVFQNQVTLKTRTGSGSQSGTAAPAQDTQPQAQVATDQPDNPYIGEEWKFSEVLQKTAGQNGAVILFTPIPRPSKPAEYPEDGELFQKVIHKSACFLQHTDIGPLQELDKLSGQRDWTYEGRVKMYNFWWEEYGGRPCDDKGIKDLAPKVQAYKQRWVDPSWIQEGPDRFYRRDARRLKWYKASPSRMRIAPMGPISRTKEDFQKAGATQKTQNALLGVARDHPDLATADQAQSIIQKLTDGKGNFDVANWPDNQEFQSVYWNFGDNQDPAKHPHGIAGQNIYFGDDILKQFSFAVFRFPDENIPGVEFFELLFGDCTNWVIPAQDIIFSAEIPAPPTTVPTGTPGNGLVPGPGNGNPPGNGLVPGGGTVTPPPIPKLTCWSGDPFARRLSDMRIGGTLRLDTTTGVHLVNGTIYTLHEKSSKKHPIKVESFDHKVFFRGEEPYRELNVFDVGSAKGAVGSAEDMEDSADYDVNYVIADDYGQTKTCDAMFNVDESGSVLLPFIAGAILGAAVTCAFTCGGGHKPKPTPTVAPKTGGSPDPGGSRH